MNGAAVVLHHLPPRPHRRAGRYRGMQVAMATPLFHWTLHPWAIYAVVGLARDRLPRSARAARS
ncbi:hypothetical protein HBB16_02050 [Pseudonocardia sp. MCCB 268]|nr:hypothetical protein [Pseudonocardia cytotoxica]